MQESNGNDNMSQPQQVYSQPAQDAYVPTPAVSYQVPLAPGYYVDDATRIKLEKKIKSGRSSILAIAILSIVNVVLLFTETAYSFPFSMSTPVIAVGLAAYGGFDSSAFLLVALLVSAVLIGLFFLLYFLSAKHLGAAVVAFVVFIVDTLILVGFAFMVGGIADFLFEIVFHVWGLASLGSLIGAIGQYRKIPFVPPMQ